MSLEIQNIIKSFPGFNLSVDELIIEDGEYFVLLGKSGSGKSLLLELISGMIIPDKGKIIRNGIDLTNQKIQARKIGLLFQDLALFPNMTIRKNIAFPLRTGKHTRKTINSRIEEIAESFEITKLLDKFPYQLSGGEKQRAALARLIAFDPEIILLDEPLSALDVQMKIEIRPLLKQINKKGITILHVTHDYEEALSLATKIGIIHQGNIIQTGSPEEVFHYPKSRFTAQLTGIRNFFKAKISSSEKEELKVADIGSGITLKLFTGKKETEGYVVISEKEIIVSNEKETGSAGNAFKGFVFEIMNSRFGYDIGVNIGVKIFVSISKESCHSLGIENGKEVWVFFKSSSVKFHV